MSTIAHVILALMLVGFVLLGLAALWIRARLDAIENRLIQMEFALGKVEESADRLRDMELRLDRIVDAHAHGTHGEGAAKDR